MELDSFLATPRWEIIKIIIQNPSSPMELSEKLGTTMSFVSQQLKLLEAAGIVEKRRTGAVEKGKPRNIFSIKKEALYTIPLAKGIPDKKLIPLNNARKITLGVWSLEEKNLQKLLERFIGTFGPHLEEVQAFFAYTKTSPAKIYLLSENKDLTHKINETQKSLDKKFSFQVISSASALEKLDAEELIQVYDPGFLQEYNSLKGGYGDNE